MLEKALDKYYEHFGKNYPLCIAESKDEKEIIAEIELCISSGKEAPEPVYEENEEY